MGYDPVISWRGGTERSFWSGRDRLLALAFLILGLIAWWSLRTQPDDALGAAPRPRLPNDVIVQLRAIETDDTGRLQHRLEARELRHFVDEGVSELDAPRLEWFEPGTPPWTASAAQGLVLDAGDHIRLSGQVALRRGGDPANRAVQLQTEQLEIWRQAALAATEHPVEIRSDGDTLTATGMRLWYAEPQRSTFHGRTRIRIAPEQEISP